MVVQPVKKKVHIVKMKIMTQSVCVIHSKVELVLFQIPNVVIRALHTSVERSEEDYPSAVRERWGGEVNSSSAAGPGTPAGRYEGWCARY